MIQNQPESNQATTSGQDPNPPSTQKLFLAILSILLFALMVIVLLILAAKFNLPFFKFKDSLPKITQRGEFGNLEMKKFSSEEEFKEYFQKANESGAGNVGIGFGQESGIGISLPAQDMAITSEGKSADRVSETNVQVIGIDEPDIIKTDGKNIYLSNQANIIYPAGRGIDPGIGIAPMEDRVIDLPLQSGETQIINAFPPADLAKLSSVDKQGDLLLENNILIIFSGQTIYGYDVADPKQPTQKWKVDLENNNQLITARKFNNQIYLITQSRVDFDRPCPIPLMKIANNPITIPCTDIYYPTIEAPSDVTFTASILNPQDGKVNNSTTFVGSSSASVVYVSPTSIYLTYNISKDYSEILYDFYQQEGKGLIPEDIVKKLENLKKLDISTAAKTTEIQVILEKHLGSLSEDERLKFNNEMNNKMQDYSSKHAREMEGTGIVKISLDSLNLVSTGVVPGTPLNQFSLDEYRDNLRISTTVGGGVFGQGESVNDVYILDSKLKVTGSVLDLGVGERIYSTRFIEDKGYVVTFKQIDPFYVLDLSDPQNPTKKGELKIPGFSSYLHPLATDRILGVGQENQQVKISLFDVSDASNPKEIDKYSLDEFWSEVSTNHHAFLMDENHKLFFMPGGKGGYIFSFEGDKLSLKKAVEQSQSRRAIYLEDYMYIFGEQDLIVIDETTFQTVKELSL